MKVTWVWVVVCWAVGGPSGTHAAAGAPATLVVPSAYATVDGHDGTLSLSQVLRLQEAFGASMFPEVPIVIQEIRFRPSTVYGQAFTSTIPDLQITLATTTNQPEGLSWTFANNLGSDAVVGFRGSVELSSAFAGPAGGPKEFDIALPFTAPFTYDPAAGNLLVEFRIYSPSPTTIGVDATGHSGDLAGRAYSTNPDATTAGQVDVGADIVDFVYVEVATAPSIRHQPQSQTVVVGDTTSFSVQATGSQPLTYQWRLDNTPLSNATNATLVLSDVQFAQGGEYSVEVANGVGSVVSSTAMLTVTERPSYDLSRDFSLASNPNGAWSYGAKTTLDGPLALSSFHRGDGGSHESWEFTEGVWPAIYHNASTSTFVTDGGAGVYPPGVVWYAAGEDGTPRNFGVIRFTVPAGGAGVYRLQTAVQSGLTGPASQDADFQVVYNGAELFGESLPPNSGTAYSNEWSLVDGDAVDFMIGRGADGRQYGSILKIQAAFTWRTNAAPQPPTILIQPRSQTATAGERVLLNVAARGTQPLSFQWRFNGAPLPGATSAALVLAAVQPTDAGSYDVEVANAHGSVLSATAVLTVAPRPTHDLSLDFSIGSNPNGVWSYGAKTTLDGPLTLSSFQRGNGGSLESWEFTEGAWPAVYHNATGEDLISDGGAGVYPPGAVWYAAGEDGTARNFGVIRFTVPAEAGGLYQLQAAVHAGLDGSQSKDSDFHVVYNGMELFGQFLPPNAGTGYTNALALADGDTLDFLIGRGADGRQHGSILKIGVALTWLTNAPPQPPVIFTQPQSQTLAAGQKAIFSVVAGGTRPVTYQWRFNGAALAGETNATIELPQVDLSQAGEYSVEVANALGSVISATAVLTVTAQPTYDLARDFSIGSNPNGAWSYGAKSTLGGALTLLSYGRGASPLGDEAWEFTAGRWPAVFHNVTADPIITHGGAGVYPPGAVWYAAGEDGTARNFGVIRFTVPAGAAGLYRLETTARPGLDGEQSQDSDFHVVWNGADVFGQFLPPNTPVTFSRELALLEGDTVDFLIGRGADGRQWGSILKVEATFTWITNAAPQPPAILAQPQNLTVRTGEFANFTVVARGDPPLTYQWYFDGAVIAGATAAAFEIAQTQPTDAGDYRVLVSNPLGSVTSAVATLTVDIPPAPTPPAIVTQPESRSVPAGANVSFSVVATGTPPLSFQWLFDGEELGGATQSTLTLASVQAAQAGIYSVRVFNSAGTVTSDEARLAVELNTSPPVITRQPVSHSVELGGTILFSVGATGAPPLRFQWLFNEIALPGATNGMLSIPNAQEAHAGTYSVVVSNDYGFAVSDEAILTVSNVFVGGTVNFANGAGALDAPVFDVDGVTKISGRDFRAELLAGPTLATIAVVGPSAGFVIPGYFYGGVRTIPTVRAGQSAYAQVRVWDQSLGLTYEQAAANGGKNGASSIFIVVTGGGGLPPALPASLTGLSSFALTNAVAPAPLPLLLAPAGRSEDGSLEWLLTGPPGARCVIERSTDLVEWTGIALVRTPNGVARFSDPTGGPRAYYRARLAD